MDNVKFAAIATDTLLIEPIRNLTYLWIAAGERYDIIPDLSSSVEKAIKMRLISYTHLADSSTALCSIAWIKMPGSSVDEAYTAPHDCSDFPDHDNVFPTNSRVLNPPPVPGQFFQKIGPGSKKSTFLMKTKVVDLEKRCRTHLLINSGDLYLTIS